MIPAPASSGSRQRRLAPVFPVTTRHSVSLYPFAVGAALPDSGPVIGLDVLTGGTVFHYDPWELYARGLLTSPNMVVLGQLGKGKSSLVKTHLHRQMLRGRQAYVLDPKGEYSALAALHRIPCLRLGPGSPDRLNPLDPGPDEGPEETHRRRVETVTALAACGLGRDLNSEERAAVAAATLDLPDNALLRHLVTGLLEPTRQLADRLTTTPTALAAAVRPVALELGRLLHGDLAGMLDAPTSHRLNAGGPGLILDLSAVFGTPALPAVMVCAGAWLSRALTNTPRSSSRETAAGEGARRQRLLLVDEAWAVLHLPATTAWLQALSKLARAHGVQLITVVHRASDLSGQADAGTATQSRAQGLLADAETRVLYAQTPGERAALRDLLDLTDVEAQLVTQLPPHRALWQIGRHRAVVDHVLSALERDRLVDTDQHMRTPSPAPSPEASPTAAPSDPTERQDPSLDSSSDTADEDTNRSHRVTRTVSPAATDLRRSP